MRLIGMMAAIVACLAWNVASAADQQQIALTKKLETGDLDERIRAAQTLGEIGLRAAEAVPALIKLVESDDLHFDMKPWWLSAGSTRIRNRLFLP